MMKINVQLRYQIFSFLNSRKKNLYITCFWYLSLILTSRISMTDWKQLMLCNIKSFWFVCLIIWHSIFFLAEILMMKSFQIWASNLHDIIYVWLKIVLLQLSSSTICSENESQELFNMLTSSLRRKLISAEAQMSRWQSWRK